VQVGQLGDRGLETPDDVQAGLPTGAADREIAVQPGIEDLLGPRVAVRHAGQPADRELLEPRDGAARQGQGLAHDGPGADRTGHRRGVDRRHPAVAQMLAESGSLVLALGGQPAAVVTQHPVDGVLGITVPGDQDGRRTLQVAHPGNVRDRVALDT